ncbi:carbohydrate ABC transporter permease [Pelagovum pacificum]|nr:carbohydrate ABC transporter permease [Pelagovum pacificum]QQA41770.1 carbohydrate ABC transporter permease [Pelagovum pacificum]
MTDATLRTPAAGAPAFRPGVLGGRLLAYAALLIAVMQAMGPVVWVIAGSLKDRSEFYVNPWGAPQAWNWANYSEAFEIAHVGDYIVNSLITVGMGLAILMFTASTTAYALARFRFRGQGAVLGLILCTMMIPPDILTIPIFVTMRELGILGTRFGLACLYAAGGFGMAVFLLRSYFLAIPTDLEEAAVIEGAGPLKVLWFVILPLALPGVLAVIIIQSMSMWNDLYLAFVFLRDPDLATVPVGLLNFFQRDQIDWPRLLAALSALTVPVLIFYAMFQRRFVEGFTAGAVK